MARWLNSKTTSRAWPDILAQEWGVTDRRWAGSLRARWMGSLRALRQHYQVGNGTLAGAISSAQRSCSHCSYETLRQLEYRP